MLYPINRKKIDPKSDRLWEAAAVIIFFGLLLWLGTSIYRDFGYSTDEIFQRSLGYDNVNFINSTGTGLLENSDRFYGPLFEIILVHFEWRFGGGTDQGAYFSRHLGTFLSFYAGVWAFYLLTRQVLGSWRLALLGCWMLVLSPRIFGNAFYNSKDIPFMAAYILSMLTLLWFLKNPNWATAVLHGLISGALMAVRLPGLLIVLITGFIVGISWLFSSKDSRQSFIKTAGLMTVYLAIAACAMVLMFPLLWSDPIRNFWNGFLSFSRYDEWGGSLLYLGEVIGQDQIPWHYSLVWIAISTPVVYSLLFLVGLVNIGRKFLPCPRLIIHPEHRFTLAVLLSFFLPLWMAVSGRMILYNSWRHLFFIYPSFLLIGLAGFRVFTQALRTHFGTKVMVAASGLILLGSSVATAYAMISSHPYEGIYFNSLAAVGLQTDHPGFEMDYWGLSYREALEYILAIDSSADISVMGGERTAEWSAYLLKPDDQARISFTEKPEEAKYFITTGEADCIELPEEYAGLQIMYSVKRGDIILAAVYQLR